MADLETKDLNMNERWIYLGMRTGQLDANETEKGNRGEICDGSTQGIYWIRAKGQ